MDRFHIAYHSISLELNILYSICFYKIRYFIVFKQCIIYVYTYVRRIVYFTFLSLTFVADLILVKCKRIMYLMK
jgi:IS4 transposase